MFTIEELNALVADYVVDTTAALLQGATTRDPGEGPGLAAPIMAPYIESELPYGRFRETADSAFVNDDVRTHGSEPGEVRFEYVPGKFFHVENHMLRTPVAKEKQIIASQKGVDLLQDAAAQIAKNLLVLNEIRVAALYQSINLDTGAYDASLGHYADYGSQVSALSGTAQWSDYTNSTPVDDIQAEIDRFVGKPVRPNVIAMSEDVEAVLARHPQVLALYSPNQDRTNLVRLPERFLDLPKLILPVEIEAGGQTVPLWSKFFWIGRLQDGNSREINGFAVQPYWVYPDEPVAPGEWRVEVVGENGIKTRADQVVVDRGYTTETVPFLGGSKYGQLIRTPIA